MYLHPRESNFSINHNRHSFFCLHETVLEQGSGRENEDMLSVENDIYVVCDGATTIGDGPNGCSISGGRQAAALTAEVLSHNHGDLKDLVHQANTEIFQAMSESSVDLDDKESLWSTSFAALRFDGDCIEWAQSGDCMIVLIHQDGSTELVTEQPGHDIATLQKWKARGPREKGSIHQVLAREIAEVRRGMNRNYGVLNGEQAALDFVNYGVKNVNTVTDILLFSDGLWLPDELPEKPLDISTTVQLYKKVGLNGIKDHIRRIQREDPRCYRYPRFKMYDDISGIALKRVSFSYSGSIP